MQRIDGKWTWFLVVWLHMAGYPMVIFLYGNILAQSLPGSSNTMQPLDDDGLTCVSSIALHNITSSSTSTAPASIRLLRNAWFVSCVKMQQMRHQPSAVSLCDCDCDVVISMQMQQMKWATFTLISTMYILEYKLFSKCYTISSIYVLGNW